MAEENNEVHERRDRPCCCGKGRPLELAFTLTDEDYQAAAFGRRALGTFIADAYAASHDRFADRDDPIIPA
jgi:hypothetical protein